MSARRQRRQQLELGKVCDGLDFTIESVPLAWLLNAKFSACAFGFVVIPESIKNCIVISSYFCSRFSCFLDSAGVEEQKWQQRERQDELAVLNDFKNMRNVGYVT